MTLPERLTYSPECIRVLLQEKSLDWFKKLWPIRVTWLTHRQRQRAQKGRRASVFTSLHTTTSPPPVLHRHTPHFFLIETFYSRSVSTFSTAIFFLSIFFNPLFFLPFLSRCLRHGQHVFSFSACNDLNLGCWVFRRHPLRNIPTCLRTLLIFFFSHSPLSSSSLPEAASLRAHCNPHLWLIFRLFPLYHGLFWCGFGFGAFLWSCSVSLVLEAVRLRGRKNNSFDFHLWGYCFSNRWGI